MSNHEDLPQDLQPVVAQLRAHRPEATALELDAIKQQVRTRVSQPARRRTRRAELMRSRMVVLTTLVFGMLLSTTGAGLAVSGLAGNNDAGKAAYDLTDNNVLGQQDQGEDSQDVLPEDSAGGNAPAGGSAPSGGGGEAAQPSRQVEAGADTGSELPFTGFAAMPILLGGLVLLAAGLVLRRKAADES